jgi:dTDP-4-dehydrorhamnose reductase
MRGGVLITGGGGFLGTRIHDALGARGEHCLSRLSEPAARADFRIRGAARELLRSLRPRVVVHTGAITNIAECEAAPELAQSVNVAATEEIALAAREIDARLIFFSTDQVWSGRKAPYRGDEPADPLHEYGRSKAAAEDAILAAGTRSIILRLALVYGRSASGKRSASEMILRAAENGSELRLFEDEWRQPVSAAQVVETTHRLLDHELEGSFALAGPEPLTRLAFGQRVVRALSLDGPQIRPVRAAELGLQPPRPADLRLDGLRLAEALQIPLPSLDEELLREHTATP